MTYKISMLYSNIFFFNDPPTTEIYTLSLHDALPISSVLLFTAAIRKKWKRLFLGAAGAVVLIQGLVALGNFAPAPPRSEEHTSELQSQSNLVCRLLLEKKK